jgi:hypothetical protein
MESVYSQWKNLTSEQKAEMLGVQMLEFGIDEKSGLQPLYCKVCGALGHYDENSNDFYPKPFCFCNKCENYFCEKCINMEMYEETDNCDSCNKKEKEVISSHTHIKTYELIRDDDLERIKYLVSIGGNFTNDSSYLAWAAEFGNLEMAKYFISLGADVSAGNDLALKWAARKGQLEMVKYLVSIGAKDPNGLALKMASDYGNGNVVKYLRQNLKK